MAFLGASRLLWAADPPNQPHMLAKWTFEVGLGNSAVPNIGQQSVSAPSLVDFV